MQLSGERKKNVIPCFSGVKIIFTVQNQECATVGHEALAPFVYALATCDFSQ